MGWESGVAVSCGVGCGCGLGLVSLWLWHRPLATGLIPPLALELPSATGEALKKKKRERKTKKKRKIT